jgi:hypothetical protein
LPSTLKKLSLGPSIYLKPPKFLKHVEGSRIFFLVWVKIEESLTSLNLNLNAEKNYVAKHYFLIMVYMGAFWNTIRNFAISKIIFQSIYKGKIEFFIGNVEC